MRLTLTFTDQGSDRLLSVRSLAGAGWEVQEERNSEVVRKALYRDWHRVERAMTLFDLEHATHSAGGSESSTNR